MYTGRYTWGEGGRAGLTIWSRARILIPLNRTDKPTDDESGRKTWEMKNGTYVFRGGSTDILTTNERGIYPSGGHQRFVTKGRNIDAACRSIFLSFSFSLLFPSRILFDSPAVRFFLCRHISRMQQTNRIGLADFAYRGRTMLYRSTNRKRDEAVKSRFERKKKGSFLFHFRLEATRPIATV